MELNLLAERPEGWECETRDLVGRTFFHESAWLDYIKSAFPSLSVQFIRIVEKAELVGYLCVLRTKRLLLGVWGSPLPGTGMYLGPLLRRDADQAEFMAIIDEYCDRSRVAHLSLCNDHLRPEVMAELGFREQRGVTFESPLIGGERDVWDRMRGTCRTRIRKALKSGLEGELTTDPSVVDEFYRLFGQTMTWKHKVAAYDANRPRELFRHLMPANKLFAVRVKHEGRLIAAGLYPHDEHAMYFWDAGYDPECVHLSPNELMHWTAMKAAIESGISVFRIGGAPQPSRFAQKFGGNLLPYVVYEKTYNLAYGSVKYLYSCAGRALDKLILSRARRAAGGISEMLLALLLCAASVA